MIKNICLVITISMVLSLFAGCQKTTSNNLEQTSSASESNSVTASSSSTEVSDMVGNMYKTGLPIVKDKVTYRFMGLQHNVVYKDLNELGIVKKWEEETNIDFEFDIITSESMVEKVNLSIATNNLPDVFYGGIAPELVKYGSEGMYIPLENLIEEWCPNIQEVFAERPDIKNTIIAPDGHIYGFPKYYETGEHNSYGFYMHMDWLTQVNKEMPTTVDELVDVLRAFKGKDLNGNGKMDEYPLGISQKDGINNYGNLFMWHGLPSYNIVHIGGDGKVQSGFTHPGYKEGAKFVNMLYADKLIDPEAYTHDVQAYRAKVKDYKYGAFFMFAPYNSFGNELNKEDYRYELVPAPKGPNGEQGWIWGRTTPQPNAMVITKECKNPEIIARFADYCATTAMSLEIAEGLLGQNLIDKGDGTYKKADPMEPHEIFGGASFDIVTNDRFTLVDPSFFGTQRKPRAEMYRPVVNMDALFPSIMPTVEESKEIAVLQTEIMNYVNQMQAKWVIDGGVEADWDTYVKQLGDMGLNDLVAIYQKQYDRYLSNK